MLLLLFAGAGWAQSQEQEANLKAVFIYNFTKYIEWENEPPGNEFIIGIMGNSSIDKPISQIALTNTVKNRRVVIRHYYKPEEIGNCQILFIPHNSPYSLQTILDKTGRGVLTVSEEPGLAKQGTAFNFIINNDKLKFEANLKALYAAGLKAGAQLLKLAVIVD